MRARLQLSSTASWPSSRLRLPWRASARAQAPEKPSLTLGVGGKGLLYYLPLTLAERLGYFKEQGLDVDDHGFRRRRASRCSR